MRLGFQLFWAAVGDIFNNLHVVLCIVLVPTLIVATLLAALINSVSGFIGMLLIAFIAVNLAISMLCAGWSRFMLTGQLPKLWIIPWYSGAMWPLIWRFVLLTIAASVFAQILVMVFSGFLTTILLQLLGNGQLGSEAWFPQLGIISAVAGTMAAWMLMIFFLCSAVKLPGVACAQSNLSDTPAIKRTAQIAWPIVVLALICALLHRIFILGVGMAANLYATAISSGSVSTLLFLSVCVGQLALLFLFAILVRVYMHTQPSTLDADVKDVFG